MAEPRSVVITGASRGLGFASAVRLHRDGWRVVAAMRTPDKGMPLLRQATGATDDDDRLIGVQLDLTDAASVTAAAKTIQEAVDAPYGLVHNAGIGGGGMVEEMPMSVWEETFATSIFGPVALTKALLPSMRKAGCGRIVLLSSAAGVRGMPATAFYSAAKGALERWGESMAGEVAPFGIGVTVLVTGTYDTDIITDAGAIDTRDFDGPYAPHHNMIGKRGLHALTQRMAKPPEKFAVSLAKSLDDTSPFARRAVGVDARMLLIANRVLPNAGMHQMTRLMMGFPRFGALRGGAAPLTMSQRALMFAATKLPAPVMARIATLMVKFGPKPAPTTAPNPESENHG